MSNKEFTALMNLMMCSDPYTCSHNEEETLKALLNKESQARGYDNWIIAYHEFQ